MSRSKCRSGPRKEGGEKHVPLQGFTDVLYFSAKFAPVFAFATRDGGFVDLGQALLA